MMTIESSPDNRVIVIRMSKAALEATWAVRKGMWYAGQHLTRQAQHYIRDEPKTGKWYILRKGKANRRYRHQASAPGESPARFTGRLARGIKFQVDGTSLDFGVDRDVDYAPYLELGTARMAKRPYLTRAVDSNAREVEQFLERELKAALGGTS